MIVATVSLIARANHETLIVVVVLVVTFLIMPMIIDQLSTSYIS